MLLVERRPRASSLQLPPHALRHRASLSLERQAASRSSRQARIHSEKNSKHSNEGIYIQSTHIERVSQRSSLEKYYELGPVIGVGNFSNVYFTLRRKDDKKCAVKEIDKRRMRGKTQFVENEVELLSGLDHRNICRLLDAFQSHSHYWLVFDYAPNGDLFETLKALGKLNEIEAANTASALAYLHRRSIVHRDIKPENLLLSSKHQIKVSDFGLACTARGPLFRVCGTPTYCAVEVLRETGYGIEVDIWSLGVILFTMLVGYAPFRSKDRSRLFRLILDAQINFDSDDWQNISPDARQLVTSMLCADPVRRPRAMDVGKNNWIQSFFPVEED